MNLSSIPGWMRLGLVRLTLATTHTEVRSTHHQSRNICGGARAGASGFTSTSATPRFHMANSGETVSSKLPRVPFAQHHPVRMVCRAGTTVLSRPALAPGMTVMGIIFFMGTISGAT